MDADDDDRDDFHGDDWVREEEDLARMERRYERQWVPGPEDVGASGVQG